MGRRGSSNANLASTMARAGYLAYMNGGSVHKAHRKARSCYFPPGRSLKSVVGGSRRPAVSHGISVDATTSFGLNENRDCRKECSACPRQKTLHG